jgi:hypothetical protein
MRWFSAESGKETLPKGGEAFLLIVRFPRIVAGIFIVFTRHGHRQCRDKARIPAWLIMIGMRSFLQSEKDTRT